MISFGFLYLISIWIERLILHLMFIAHMREDAERSHKTKAWRILTWLVAWDSKASIINLPLWPRTCLDEPNKARKSRIRIKRNRTTKREEKGAEKGTI
ncbi:unnamed protein product [Musa acuminata subsp. malaccensis]|uniref:(wild Malaysian banana) hypothetical protein n=1 Tax=Musa acuminata subsp. malaccensis TaxID=214687 RepID=A0A804K368_MUSAM|nr:unnamed protein product [Musa acuminata subsp. malaccensis]